MDEWLINFLGEDFPAKLARVPLHLTPTGVDPFGLDPEWTKYTLAFMGFFHRYYFRTEVHGADRLLPGRLLLVSNHGGQIPIDAALIATTLVMDAEPPRLVRTMVDKWTQTLPFISTLFARVGQVVGAPENAQRLLQQGETLLVFPEGAKGISKTFDKRYQLQEFGLGFMRLAIETETPIIPVAVIGNEEQYISVANLTRVASLFQMPAFPIIPQLLIPGGQLPLPTKYRLYFGEPMMFFGDPDEDDATVEEKVSLVRKKIQSLLDQGLQSRQHIFW
ncbi:glycerol acyltransferase [Pajaroellobacter abortibovis]|uniref:Glycerol acyltransferase n=1 Tax=Pajaroellobacter abortibovis TaxID=1882918 RepID=A0A1L6MZB3_9BACT|nr:glycerol acyltransferase [Pajaroellobacter abortibovis]